MADYVVALIVFTTVASAAITLVVALIRGQGSPRDRRRNRANRMVFTQTTGQR